jgi:hypothetical protein
VHPKLIYGQNVKLFGYDDNHRDIEDPVLRRLGEVTIVPENVDELRRIVAFLSDTADQLQQHGEAFGHEHLTDWLKQVKAEAVGTCDLIVSR